MVEPGTAYLSPFNLDAVAEPTGAPVTIKGQTYYLAADDDLSIDDKENLRLFSLRLREMEEWETDPTTGMMTEDNKNLMRETQLAMCRIALPRCPESVMQTLEPIQRTKLLELFFASARNLRWIDKTVFRWLQNRNQVEPTDDATSGDSIPSPTAKSSARNARTTRASSRDSAPSTAVDTESGAPSTG